ncbi:MAG TPA: hypothetical protein VFH72_14940 [Candidatus Baltobacteraceae bacterium]|nr:hypothetical protein [Candidatus Baltobacteraceae bacterium]
MIQSLTYNELQLRGGACDQATQDFTGKLSATLGVDAAIFMVIPGVDVAAVPMGLVATAIGVYSAFCK